MKKLLLTIGSTALLSIAALAQQDTTQSNQYRPMTPPQPGQPTDSAQINEDAREQGQDIRRGVDSINYNSGVVDSTGYNMQQPADTLQQGTEQSGDGSESAVDQGMEQGEEGANVMTQESAQEPQPSDRQTRDGQEASLDRPSATPSEIEVFESKEGPNNEVVYKIQGELYYVDRNEKKLVKADESELKDTEHEIKIHEGTATEDNTDRDRQRTKG